MKKLVILLFLSLSLQSIGQNLPNHQEESLIAPTIKVDGIANEWGNKFKAYNKATSIFYTIANNAENLYFTFQARDKAIIDKIMGGGITLYFNDPNVGKAARSATITYSALSINSRISISLNRKDTSAANIDNINKQLASATKEIKIAGLYSLKDTLLSVYNELGIMAAVRLNSYSTYTYELCVPIKYIRPFFNNKLKIKYTMQVNGVNTNNMAVVVDGKPQQTPSAATLSVINSMLISDVSSSGTLSLRDFTSPTNFSDEYTLAK